MARFEESGDYPSGADMLNLHELDAATVQQEILDQLIAINLVKLHELLTGVRPDIRFQLSLMAKRAAGDTTFGGEIVPNDAQHRDIARVLMAELGADTEPCKEDNTQPSRIISTYRATFEGHPYEITETRYHPELPERSKFTLTANKPVST